jgi:proline racemase
LDGLPPVPEGDCAQQAAWLDQNAADWMKRVILEPRGYDAIVGAVLLPEDHLIFFNNVGTLRMCGHGTIGVASTLVQLGLRSPGIIEFQTPVGPVSAHVQADQRTVSIQNVPSWVIQAEIEIDVPEIGIVTGDACWGGNGFFLTSDCPIPLERENVPRLLDWTIRVKEALAYEGWIGKSGASLDHIELTAPANDPTNHGRNFVLCPGNQYDRCPCGTGTSAKVALLASQGRLQPGEEWRQEGILGTVFSATYETAEQGVIPTITGRAFLTGRSTLLYDPLDPL